jgi:hypothetical protein
MTAEKFEKFSSLTRMRSAIAAAREKNWAESMQSGSIHAMVALNERRAAL